jgi:hypothetical protein
LLFLISYSPEKPKTINDADFKEVLLHYKDGKGTNSSLVMDLCLELTSYAF